MSRSADPTTLGPSMSLAAWVSLPEDAPGEWVDGRLEGEEVPDFVHEVVVAWLIQILGAWVRPRGGMVSGSEAKFVVSARRGRKPDLTVYLPGTRLPAKRGAIRRPPDIAIEVVSPTPRDGRRDRVDKSREYAQFGVRYYWIVDPELRSLEILELGKDGRYVVSTAATAGKLKSIPGCRGLVLDLGALWREVERLPNE